MLKKGNLIENKDKREEFHIPDEKDKWKNCKCLGTFMDTEKDINNRKILAFDSMSTLQPLLKSRDLAIETKLRIFNAYVASIFLYNCGLWTTTKTINNKLDSFHRRLLRKTLGINWPNKISNIELYEKTKERKWSNIVKERRLSWLGHLLRLDAETPARKALQEYIRTVTKNQGGRKTTWFDIIKKELKNNKNLKLNYNNDKMMIEELIIICSDKKNWKNEIKYMMLNTTDM